MARWPLTFWSLVAVLAGSADGRSAVAAGFDLDFFKPTTPTTGTFCEENGFTVERGRLDVALTTQYSHRPLVLRDQKTGMTGGDVVRDRLTGFVTTAFGVTDRIDAGGRLAMVLHQTGDVDVDLSNEGGGVPGHPRAREIGDTDLFMRVTLLRPKPERHQDVRFRLTLTAGLGIPTGARDALAGSGKVSFRPRLTAGWQTDRWSAAGSAGYVFRSVVEIPSSRLVVGDAVVAGAGFACAIIPGRLWLEGEISASVGVSDSQTGAGSVATQLIAGPRVILPGELVLQAGAGGGLNHEAGSPRAAAVITLGRVFGAP